MAPPNRTAISVIMAAPEATTLEGWGGWGRPIIRPITAGGLLQLAGVRMQMAVVALRLLRRHAIMASVVTMVVYRPNAITFINNAMKTYGTIKLIPGKSTVSSLDDITYASL
jgi:hypothetical protein